MLANKLPTWWSSVGWISTSVMSLGGNRSEWLEGGIVGLFPLSLDSVAMVMVTEITILLSEESIRGLYFLLELNYDC